MHDYVSICKHKSSKKGKNITIDIDHDGLDNFGIIVYV